MTTGNAINPPMRDFDIAATARFGDAPMFVFCDHASNAMPPEFAGLGLPDDILETHIAWDVGAGALTTALAEKLNAVAFSCGFSRLIVDANRSPEAGDLIPATSDQIPIPGNRRLTGAARRARLEAFHGPYHQRLSAAIGEFADRRAEAMIVCVHSFTRRLVRAREDRPWPIGMLWSADEPSARAMIAFLERETGWAVGDNEPYDAREFNYSIDRHVSPRGLRHLTIEVRQDLLAGERAVIDMASLIADGVRAVASGAKARKAAS